MTLVHLQDKSFKITVVHVCAPTSNGEKSEVEPFYENF